MAGRVLIRFLPRLNLISKQNISNQRVVFDINKKFVSLLNTHHQKLINLKLYSTTTPENKTEEQTDAQEEAVEVKSKVVRPIIPVETSLKYLKSKAYETTYGNDPVWKHYRRNFKGWRIPYKTRKKCIRQGVVSTGNPCPICRDEYLVLDYENVDLLNQFISPITGQVYEAKVTGLCRMRQTELLVAVAKAQDYGKIVFQVPHREYDYNDYLTTNK